MARMSPRQFREAQAAAALDPFIEERIELGFARLMCMAANMLGGKDRTWTVDEFMIDYVTPPEVQAEERERDKAARIKNKMAAVRLARLVKGD